MNIDPTNPSSPGSENSGPLRGFNSDLEEVGEVFLESTPHKKQPKKPISRKARVTGPYSGPLTRRRKTSHSASSAEGRRPPPRESSQESLSWDTFADRPTGREGSASSRSTHFEVTIDASVHDSRIDEINKVLNEGGHNITITSEADIEADTEGDTSCSPNNTQVTVRTNNRMTGHDRPPPEAAAHVKVIKRAEMLWNSEFDGSDPVMLAADRLRKRTEKVEKVRDDVMESLLELDMLDIGDYWNLEKSTMANNLCNELSRYLRICESALGESGGAAEGANPVVDAVRQVKTARVYANKERLIKSMSDLQEQMSTLDISAPDDEPGYRTYQGQLTLYKGQCTSLVDDAKDILSDATECGMVEESKELDNAIRLLKAQDHTSSAKLQDKKAEFGFIDNGQREIIADIPPPVFTGNPTETDFYSFLDDWKKYTGARHLNEPEKMRVLQKMCLKGAAANVGDRYKTVAEVIEGLRESYGNPRYLFSIKMDNMKKMGKCQGTHHKKREWAVELRSKMEEINTLATNHSLLDNLYHSPIIGLIESMMTYQMVEGYKKLIKKDYKDGCANNKVYWDLMVKHVDSSILELTFEINHSLNTQADRVDEKVKDQGKKGNEHKKTFVAQQVVTSTAVAPVQRSKPALNQAKVKKKGKTKVNEGETPVIISVAYTDPKDSPCKACNNSHKYLFSCIKFQEARGKDRLGIASKNRACFRCLRLDAQYNRDNIEAWWNGHEPQCVTSWNCKVEKCPSRPKMRQFHILMCGYHTDNNKEHEKQFISEMDPAHVTSGLRFFFHEAIYQMDSAPTVQLSLKDNEEPDFPYPSIFQLQYVEVEGVELLLFYDSGCGGSSLSDKAAALLNSVQVRPGPTLLNVAGGQTIKLETGDDRFSLQLTDSNRMAVFTGLRMPEITTKFPTWDIARAWSDVMSEIKRTQDTTGLVFNPPDQVGGDVVDLLIGIKYIKYHPKLLFFLPSGLGVYQSYIAAPRGETTILGGPHPSWIHCREEANFSGPHGFFSSEMRAYFFSCITLNHVYSSNEGVLEVEGVGEGEPVDEGEPVGIVGEPVGEPEHVADQIGFLHPDPTLEKKCQDFSDTNCSQKHCSAHKDDCYFWTVPQHWVPTPSLYTLKEETSKFLKGEMVGSEISYRCIRCRNCASCRNAEDIEAISFREEREQALIEDAVRYDAINKRLVSKLPFIADPKETLFPNRYQTEKILDGQMKKIRDNPDMKDDILTSFEKLASKGYVVPITTLEEEKKKMIHDDFDSGYFIPWRSVWKETSISTPCRMVFDASAKTPGGLSLNDILAKGQNQLVNIFHLLVKFRCKKSAFCTDIRMAYNQISLDPAHLRYQKFLWKEGLLDSSPVEEYVVTTLIYGVRPVGNSLQAGLKKLYGHVRENYPEHLDGAAALINSTYVDDCAQADHSSEQSRATADSLNFVLSQASMVTKGYTFSGSSPPDDLSPDGKNVGLVGLNWNPEKDFINVEIKPLYFGKPKRGKLPDPVKGDFSDALKKNFTRRNMLGKVAGVFDPLGLTTPLTAGLKLDLHDLVDLKLSWDQSIPDSFFEKWIRNIEKIQDIREIMFARTIIPEDAISPEVELIISSDASQYIAVATVHGRVRRKNGEYSCTLIAAKSKLTKELTIPKAELRGAVLATHLAHSIKHDVGEQLKWSIYVTDSSIVLFWLNQDQRPLGVTVRNAVIEIRRYTNPSQWFHVDTKNNIADLGTRPCEVEEIVEGSDWQQGRDWMRKDRKDMPIRSIDDIKLSQEEKKLASQDLRSDNICGIMLPMLSTKVSDRYCKMNYIVDPNRYSWEKSVKVAAYIIKYVRMKAPGFSPEWFPPKKPGEDQTAMIIRDKPALNIHDVKCGENYFFSVATREIEEFGTKNDLKDTDKRMGIRYYVGRILDGQEINTPVDTMFDTPPLKFVRPVIDRYSPVAYSVMVHAHTNLTHHRNSATTLTKSREIAYILRGRDLALEIRAACRSCIRYKAELTKVELGKIHESRLTVAPPFYLVQVDLMGPLKAICEHNHRSTTKIWACVFRDPASCAVAIHVMPGYSTEHFLMAYTRFSARYGHPSHLLIDEGANLTAAMKRGEISYTDLSNHLSTKYKVGLKYTTCPVGGHNVNGAVERSIRTIQALFERVYHGIKMDIMSYETCFAWISSQLNDLPISLGSRTDNLDNVDIICPNRLILGRSSGSSIGGYARVSPPTRLIDQLDSVYRSWWNVWLNEKLSDYIPQPNKWRKNELHIRVGDIVLMLQNDEEVRLGGPIWRIARVISVETSANDGYVRAAVCEYRIPGEKKMRQTRRSVRKLAVVHQEDDLDVIQQLNQAAREAGLSYHAARAFDPP